MMWASQRAKDHHELVAELYQRGRDVPCERISVMAGGLRGADLDGAMAQAGVVRSRYLTLSIDAVLAEMAARGLIPLVAGLSPLAAAGLVHDEAQYLAKRVGLLALRDGRNLILEVSLASARAAESWMYAMRFAGYAVTAVFADIGIEEAVRRGLSPRGRRVSPRAGLRWPGHPGGGHPGAGRSGGGRRQESRQMGLRRAGHWCHARCRRSRGRSVYQ
jgi:hypothetical protein